MSPDYTFLTGLVLGAFGGAALLLVILRLAGPGKAVEDTAHQLAHGDSFPAPILNASSFHPQAVSAEAQHDHVA